ncbi:hypothetical protein [Nocardia sp. NBC_01388]|uniref:hypothetical protein n=1 Tax=Nocardia sp. NBC_01388 TaxID=2903596 RepID=UPI0032467CE1
MSLDDLPPELRAALLSTPEDTHPNPALEAPTRPAKRESDWDCHIFEEPPRIRVDSWDDMPPMLVIPDTVRLRPFTILDKGKDDDE